MLQRRVQSSARLLRAVTGFSRDEFHQLLPAFAHAYQASLDAAWTGRVRRRRVGGGRAGQLPSLADKLLFILVYVHCYPIQELQGVLFGFGQSQASDWVLRLLPVLQAALGHEVALPARPPADLDALARQCSANREIGDSLRCPLLYLYLTPILHTHITPTRR